MCSHSFRLPLTVPPTAEVIPNNVVVVNYNLSTIPQCNVRGIPAPTVTWIGPDGEVCVALSHFRDRIRSNKRCVSKQLHEQAVINITCANPSLLPSLSSLWWLKMGSQYLVPSQGVQVVCMHVWLLTQQDRGGLS